jgi:Uma2 family endonuclease
MAGTALSQATYRDIVELPEGVVGEIISGVLHTQPRPRFSHARAASKLGAKLDSKFDPDDGGPGGWIFLDEPELHCSEDVLVPDIAGWRTERAPDLATDAWTSIPPDWVCEVLSPSTEQKDRVLKMPIYARVAVAHVWLVNPDFRKLEAYTLREGERLCIAALKENDTVGVAPFAAAPFRLGALWTPKQGDSDNV